MMRAIGLMSGTSLDGIDVALIETDGETVTQFGPSATEPYQPAEREVLRRALAEGRTLSDRIARPGVLGEAERMVTALHAAAVERFLGANAIARETIDVVGFHGQTVLHRPQARLTVQIGDGDALAGALNIPVAFDFRADDVAAGGQGAPLVPVFHRAIAATIDRARPLMVLNVGGVANITYIADGADPIASDTGPGNALIDDFMRERTGAAYDDGGDTAAPGPGGRGIHRSRARRSVFCRAIAEIARSQCLRLRQSWARRIFAGRRRRHAGGAHRHGGGAHRAAAAGPAGLRHRRGRRRPQPHPDGDAGAASRARAGSKPQPRSAGRRMRSKPRPLRSSPYGRCADCRSPFRPPPGSPRPLPGGIVAIPFGLQRRAARSR